MAKTAKKAPAKKAPAKKTPEVLETIKTPSGIIATVKAKSGNPSGKAARETLDSMIKASHSSGRVAKPDPEGFERKYIAKETMKNGVQRLYYKNAEGILMMELVIPESDQAKVYQKETSDGRVELIGK